MNKKKDHRISLATATDMTRRLRENKPQGLANSETFGKDAVLKLLNTKGCASLQIYYGLKEDKEIHAILVAADADGNAILPTGSGVQNSGESTEGEEDVLILDDAWRCPPVCGGKSPLTGE